MKFHVIMGIMQINGNKWRFVLKMLLYSYIMNIKWKKIGVAYVRTCSEKNRN